MATLPQASDYGKRVQLRSTRVDIPGQGELAVASALERAAGTFVNMAIEHKEKDDAISYSNAKNEYLIADIQERQRLAEDQDFATHDDRYRTAMKGHYDRLFPTVRSQRDRVLFDAESRLQNERGSVAVGDNARTKKIDYSVGQWKKHGVETRAVVMAASDAATATEAMYGFLEEGNALAKAGLIKQEELQLANEAYVTSVATGRLTAMAPADRKVALERSITMTKTQGSPITRDQIRAGEGSQSMADFMTLDDRQAMLEVTNKGLDHDDIMDAAYGIYDEVLAQNRDPSKVGAALNEAGKGQSADVRSALRTLGVQYRQDYSANKGILQGTVMDEAQGFMNAKQNPETMLGDRWGEMSHSQQKAIKAEWISRLDRDGFGEFDVMYTEPRADEDSHSVGPDGEILLGGGAPDPSFSYWMSIPRAERVNIKLDQSPWRMAFTKDKWEWLKKEQGIIEQENASGKTGGRTPGPTILQRVRGGLVNDGIIPPKDTSEDDEQIYWATVMNYHMAVANAEELKGDRLTTEEEELVYSQMMSARAFSDSFYQAKLWPGGPDTDDDEKTSIGAATPEKLNKMRTPFSGQTTTVGGIPMTHRQKLENMAIAEHVGLVKADVSENDYQRAHFAMVNLLGTNGQRYNISTITEAQMADVDLEVERRLKGD